MRIKTGDKVQFLSGKDHGKTGKMLQVFPRLNKASVEGLNMLVKHLPRRNDSEKGQKVQFASPVNMDKLMLVCPRCGQPTRVGVKLTDDKKRVRVCKQCKETI